MKENQALIAIIYEIVKSLRRVSDRTRIMKLVYLVDLMAAKETGHPASGVKWSSYASGPFSNEVLDTLSYMNGRFIEEEWYTDAFGDRVYTYYFPKDGPAMESPSIDDPAVKKIMAQVIQKWGSRPLREFLDHVYDTEPLKSAGPGGEIELHTLAAR